MIGSPRSSRQLVAAASARARRASLARTFARQRGAPRCRAKVRAREALRALAEAAATSCRLDRGLPIILAGEPHEPEAISGGTMTTAIKKGHPRAVADLSEGMILATVD